MRAFRYYRFYFTGSTWTCVTEMGLYASNDATGTNLLTGSTATSSGDYSGYPASNAIDGTTTANTGWAASGSAGPHWLAFDLGSALEAHSFKITSNISGWNAPVTVRLDGSDDGSTWITIATFPSFNPTATSTITDKLMRIYDLVGTSTLDTTVAATKVRICDWTTGALIADITPDAAGYWEMRVESNSYVLVTHIGPPGYRPISDGPIEPA
jgi:hypothetical protein